MLKSLPLSDGGANEKESWKQWTDSVKLHLSLVILATRNPEQGATAKESPRMSKGLLHSSKVQLLICNQENLLFSLTKNLSSLLFFAAIFFSFTFTPLSWIVHYFLLWRSVRQQANVCIHKLKAKIFTHFYLLHFDSSSLKSILHPHLKTALFHGFLLYDKRKGLLLSEKVWTECFSDGFACTTGMQSSGKADFVLVHSKSHLYKSHLRSAC